MHEKQQILMIYIGDLEKYKHTPLYEAIVYAAKKFGLKGATVFKGIMSFGPNSAVHSTKLFALSSDLPVKIEIIDKQEKIQAFTEIVRRMLDKSKSTGVIAIQNIEVIN